MSKMKLPPRLPPKPIPSKNSKNRYNQQHIDLTKLIDSNYSQQVYQSDIFTFQEFSLKLNQFNFQADQGLFLTEQLKSRKFQLKKQTARFYDTFSSHKNIINEQNQTGSTFSNGNQYIKKSMSADTKRRSRKSSNAQSKSGRSVNGYDMINQYQILKQIGHGGFSSVKLCRDEESNQLFALKIVEKNRLRAKLQRKNSTNIINNYVNNEIAILKKIEHPNIVKLHEVIEDEMNNTTYIILDYCENGFINQIREHEMEQEGAYLMTSKTDQNETNQLGVSLLKYRRLSEQECQKYYRQLAFAIEYLHNTAKIAHRDIKPENILLSEKNDVKLSDFGLGTDEIETPAKLGTRGYFAPQILDSTMKKDFNNGVTAQMGDIWALGITLMVLLEGRQINEAPEVVVSYIDQVKSISNDCRDFLRKCLNLNPTERITASQIVKHPWILTFQPQKFSQLQITEEDKRKATSLAFS